MNNNINLYIGKSGKYSPKMSENRRMELKNLGNGSDKSLPKKLNDTPIYSDIWSKVRTQWATIDFQALV